MTDHSPINRFGSLKVLTLAIAGFIGSSVTLSVQADQRKMLEETVFSKTLRFQGQVIEVLPSGQAIREFAIFRGRKFEWAGETKDRRATNDERVEKDEEPFDINKISLDELAEDLRGLALFNGHEFIEMEPAYELAKQVKEYEKLMQSGASQDELDKFFPSAPPSQGNARYTEDPDEINTARAPTKSVHGPIDDRDVMNNMIYPHRVHIVFDNTGSSTSAINGSQGSGSLIGPSTAMSVAHVFWDEGNNTWEADHKWAPGFDSQDADPSPWGNWYRCYWVTIPVGYTIFENSTYDYAVLDFDVGCNSVRNGVNSDRPGATVGWLGHYTASASSIEARTGYVRGYPGVGTCGFPAQSCNVRVWGDLSWASENDATSGSIRHQADTSGGQSGSAFYHYNDPSCAGCGFGPYLVGMHRAGSTNYNLARRFTSTVYSFMKAFSSDY